MHQILHTCTCIWVCLLEYLLPCLDARVRAFLFAGVRACTFAPACTGTCIRACARTCTRVCMCMCVHAALHACANEQAYVHAICLHIRLRARLSVCLLNACMRVYVHTSVGCASACKLAYPDECRKKADMKLIWLKHVSRMENYTYGVSIKHFLRKTGTNPRTNLAQPCHKSFLQHQSTTLHDPTLGGSLG